ncbi:PREDICTED: vegetative cell wall protein gp1-like [Erythranthe guttata]|uniref:vegetative cell wall protein gp1-like n=1 Tax=Erythranthe guttata TaxID=4155 RepID=UPI00064DDF8D|nr:PREDICTED: vegetative cell wall protein gp1-like [Erythranthe guttata]|eukprot:XP_012829742.1 PREDICTED: vegetative cell wall protein gp1-like [Erythranthe guttata]
MKFLIFISALCTFKKALSYTTPKITIAGQLKKLRTSRPTQPPPPLRRPTQPPPPLRRPPRHFPAPSNSATTSASPPTSSLPRAVQLSHHLRFAARLVTSPALPNTATTSASSVRRPTGTISQSTDTNGARPSANPPPTTTNITQPLSLLDLPKSLPFRSRNFQKFWRERRVDEEIN